MATCSTDRNFSTGLLYALKKLGRPNISLKKDLIMSIECYIYDRKVVYVWLPTVFEIVCFQVLPFIMEHNEQAV